MELMKLITLCCLISILLLDVIVASPINARDLAEVDNIEYAIEEGLAIYRAERKRRRRYRRRTNRFIAMIRLCRNYRHYPIERIPAHCRSVMRNPGHRHQGNRPTIVIIEK